jgi:hypothetical protein
MNEEQKAKMKAGRAGKAIGRGERTHTVRTADGGTITLQRYGMRMAIKAFCTECMGFQGAEVVLCTSPMCPLFPFRKQTRATAKGQEAKKTTQNPTQGIV